MKYVCMDYERCDYYQYLTDEDLTSPQLPVINCPQCNSLAVLVANSYNIKEELEEHPYFLFEED